MDGLGDYRGIGLESTGVLNKRGFLSYSITNDGYPRKIEREFNLCKLYSCE